MLSGSGVIALEIVLKLICPRPRLFLFHHFHCHSHFSVLLPAAEKVCAEGCLIILVLGQRWSLLLLSALLIEASLEGEADRGVLLLILMTLRFQTVMVQVVCASQLPGHFIADTVLTESHFLVRELAIVVV